MKHKLRKFTQDRYRIALFRFDLNQRFVLCDGYWMDYTSYSTTNLIDKNVSEVFPFLHGLNTSEIQDLPLIEISENCIVDINLVPDTQGFDVYLMNSGLTRNQLREIQQIANETYLREEKLIFETKKLEIENLAKSRFIASFGHELYTPLTSLIGYSERLLQACKNKTDKYQLEAVNRNSHYLRNMIDNILDQHRMDINQISINDEVVKLSDVINDAKRIIEGSPVKTEVRYETIWNGNEKTQLSIDRQHLTQVIVNLLSNAYKYTHEGNVVMEIMSDDEFISLSIIDTGIGIPENELAKVQDNYSRASNVSGYPGTGIGLSLSKRLIELMRGKFSISSDVGKGTRVTIRFPVNTVARVSDSASLYPVSLLVLDDDPDILNLIEFYVAGENISYTGVTEIDKALKILQFNPPDIVLIDYYLGGSTGLQLTKTIREKGYKGKIVIITASHDSNLKESALDLGCNDLINKPFNKKSILDLMKL